MQSIFASVVRSSMSLCNFRTSMVGPTGKWSFCCRNGTFGKCCCAARLLCGGYAEYDGVDVG